MSPTLTYSIGGALAGALIGLRLALPSPVVAPSQAEIELDAYCTLYEEHVRAYGTTTAAQRADVLTCNRRAYKTNKGPRHDPR